MNRVDRGKQMTAHGQRGTTLIVALVLVLLASLLALFAVNVGLFEQRASAADVRARLVQQAAEAALSQGMEYIKLNTTTALDPTNTTLWAQCTDTDTSFPCGSVPRCATGSGTTTCAPDSLGVSTARRSNMYYFIGGAGYDVNGSGSSSDTMDKRSLPLDRLINLTGAMSSSSTGTVGNGYAVNYGVGALLCMVKKTVPTVAVPTPPTECTSDPTKASNVKIVTLVGTASIPAEGASTTLSTMMGVSTSINAPANAPPIMASGMIDATGNLQIVTNPNSAGPGVPISVWTRLDASKTGTPNTCYLDGFIRDQKGNATPIYEGSKTKIITCDTCACTTQLSYTDSGNKQQQGIDVLDVDTTPQCTNTVTTSCKPNLNVQQGEFPCDLFNFVFPQKAWQDTDSDGFCESRMQGSYKGVTMGADEAYLYQKATFIIPTAANATAAYLAGDPRVTTCAAVLNDSTSTTRLKGSSYGIVWDQQGCGIGSNNQVGTVDNPVLLVEDGTTKIQGRLFGMLYVRPAFYGDPGSPSTQKLDPATGASSTAGASLSTDAGAAIYGAVIVHGTVSKINGTSAVVYNGQVLSNLAGEAQLNLASSVPGSWSDRFAY